MLELKEDLEDHMQFSLDTTSKAHLKARVLPLRKFEIQLPIEKGTNLAKQFAEEIKGERSQRMHSAEYSTSLRFGSRSVRIQYFGEFSKNVYSITTQVQKRVKFLVHLVFG